MTKNIWPVMPIMMIGSSIASILTIFFGVHDPAPHGGFLVLPVVDGGLQWVIAILIGAIVGGILFVIFKKASSTTRSRRWFPPSRLHLPPLWPLPLRLPLPTVSSRRRTSSWARTSLVCDDVLSFISNEAVKNGIADDADALMQAFL